MSRLRALAIALLGCVVLGACASGDAADDAVAFVDDDIPAEAIPSTLAVPVLKTERTYVGFATEGGGFGQAGHLMKYFIDVRNGAKSTYFVNANYTVDGVIPAYAKYHYDFAKHQLAITDDPASFNTHCYYSDDKHYIGGSIQTYTIANETVYAIQFYPDDVIHEEGILAAANILRPQITIPNAKVVFVATGPQQTFTRVADQLRAIGVEPMTIDQVLGTLTYLPLNPGDAWGYLRIFPTEQGELRPTDIPVFDELPLDLSVVAGTITRSYQDVTSHVNLKSKERGTPNMVLRDASPTKGELAALANRPVHLSVKKTGYVLEPTTAELVEQKRKERTDRPWIPLAQVNQPSLVDFDSMCRVLGLICVSDGGRFGGKATNLGFLANVAVLGRWAQESSKSHRVGYDLVPYGFGVPVQRYRDFLAANPAVAAAVSTLIAREKGGELSPNERAAMVADVQALFLRGRVPDAELAELETKVATLRAASPGLVELKFRSSSNAEDVPNFDGAGLHDSYSVRVDAADLPDRSCTVVRDGAVVTKSSVEPATIQCAVKGVYASLWNTRAIEERSFARLDHVTSAMGIAVVPAYDTDADVVANGVVITRVINGSDVIGYTLTLQVGNNLVTNPDPGTIAQLSVVTFSADAARPDRFTVARYATPVPNGVPSTRPVLSDAMMGEIVSVVRQVEFAYCLAKPTYNDGNCGYVHYSTTKASSLDLEWKLLADRRIVVKQTREFHGK